MRKLSPPFVEIAFALERGVLASAMRTLVGQDVEAEAGMSTNVEAPGIVGVSQGVERIAVTPTTLAVLAEAEPEPQANPYSSCEAAPLRLRVRTCLVEIASKIDFVYAAILVEERMESAEELLAVKGGSYAFRTFALSATHFDEDVLGAVLRLLPEAHFERFAWGWFLSSERSMIPSTVGAPGLSHDDAARRSLDVSRVVASALERGELRL